MNNKLIQSIFLTALMLLCFNVNAEYSGMSTLTGQYDITGKTSIDPPGSEPRDTHFRVYITGEAAKDLYNNMKAKPIEDLCLDDGSISKFSGHMQCTKIKNKGNYECRFAIDIQNQKIDYGWAC